MTTDPISIDRNGHRTWLKWHRAKRRASDPVFTGKRILEGMALGASVRQLVSGMMGETMRTAAIGLAGGAAVALALNRAAAGAILLAPPVALRPYVVAIGIMLLATATAALLPSLRTSRIDPSKALRVE